MSLRLKSGYSTVAAQPPKNNDKETLNHMMTYKCISDKVIITKFYEAFSRYMFIRTMLCYFFIARIIIIQHYIN